jgi:hypothetical protein
VAAQNPVVAAALRSIGFRHEAEGQRRGVVHACCLKKEGRGKGSGDEGGTLLKGVRWG